jgi:hypothetical protein
MAFFGALKGAYLAYTPLFVIVFQVVNQCLGEMLDGKKKKVKKSWETIPCDSLTF